MSGLKALSNRHGVVPEPKEDLLIVVGYDGSEQSDLALRRGIEEAALREAELHVVHVVDVTPAVLHLSGGG